MPTTLWRRASPGNRAGLELRPGQAPICLHGSRAALGVGPDLRGVSFRGRPVVKAASLCDDSHVAVRVLIVDDHPVFRSSARTLLELDGFEIVGEAGDGASGVELARELEPELVLLDIALPDTTGFDVAERLAGGPSKVVLTSSREQRDLGRRLSRSGAVGFLPKDQLSGSALAALLEEER
jgi:CheY-like chemotaxis protein